LKSIQAFGFRVPIVINSKNVIVAGHTRLLAAKELELEKVPCVIADDLTDEQVRAFRLVDNKTSEASTWDWDKLDEELRSIAEFPDLDAAGFPKINMEEFGFDMSRYTSGDEIEDFFEKVPETPGASSGSAHKAKTAVCPYCGKEFPL